MRGHVIKRYKDSYTIVLNLGIDPSTGKRRQQWISVKGTKREAEKRLSDLLHQLDTGTFMKPGRITLAEYLERWLKDYAKPNLTPRSFERYESIVRVHFMPTLSGIPLTQLRPEHLQKHYTAKLNDGLSARTVKYHHAVIHVALKTAVKWGLLSRNPADAVSAPRARRTEMQTWDEDQLARFLEAAKDTPYHSLFYTALFTGMRRSELLALRWQDVDFMLGQVYVNRSLHHLKDGSYLFTEPKSAKSRRTIALPPSATLLLQQYHEMRKLDRDILGRPLGDGDLIFSTLDGKPLRPNTVTRAWTTLAARASLKVIRLHDARHTHASIMLKQGIHPKIVQERLGHSSIGITLDTYSHVAPGLQEAAANRFDELVVPRREKEAIEKFG
ncbi:MAG: site-specific integrase [Chloroflexi bacterium]|nr:site-specific integrase [Chloroflexota bacterium]